MDVEMDNNEIWAVIQERVNNGADYLDKHYPNWYRQIDVDKLGDLWRKEIEKRIRGEEFGNRYCEKNNL